MIKNNKNWRGWIRINRWCRRSANWKKSSQIIKEKIHNIYDEWYQISDNTEEKFDKIEIEDDKKDGNIHTTEQVKTIDHI